MSKRRSATFLCFHSQPSFISSKVQTKRTIRFAQEHARQENEDQGSGEKQTDRQNTVLCKKKSRELPLPVTQWLPKCSLSQRPYMGVKLWEEGGDDGTLY